MSLLWLSSCSHWTSPEALAHNRRQLTHVTVVLSLQSGASNTRRGAVEEAPSPSITAKTRRAVRTAAITVTVAAEAQRHPLSPTLCPDVLSRFIDTLLRDSKYFWCRSLINNMSWTGTLTYSYEDIWPILLWQLTAHWSYRNIYNFKASLPAN